jgi:hypothetical protein
MTQRDANQIAYGILLQAATTEPRPSEPPAHRLLRAIAYLGGQASKAKITADNRKANGLKGALKRWGAIRERDNSPMPARPKNLDMNQLAKRILDEAVGDEPKAEPPPEPAKKNKAAVALGKIGGKKGGAARAASLSPDQWLFKEGGELGACRVAALHALQLLPRSQVAARHPGDGSRPDRSRLDAGGSRGPGRIKQNGPVRGRLTSRGTYSSVMIVISDLQATKPKKRCRCTQRRPCLQKKHTRILSPLCGCVIDCYSRRFHLGHSVAPS